MSELIVGKVTTPGSDPLTIDGSRKIKVDVIQDHLGEVKVVSKIATVHPESDADLANDNEFIFYESSGILTFKSSLGPISLGAGVDPIIPEGYKEFVLSNYQVLTAWQELPVVMNMYSGTYAVQVYAVDSAGNRAIYSGVFPFISKVDQPILADGTSTIQLTRSGEDNTVLELRVRRVLAGDAVKLEIKGSVNPLAPHASITLKFRSLL